MQKHVNLVDLVKSFPTNMFLQNLASIQKRTSRIKFDHLAENSEYASISNPSTKVCFVNPPSNFAAVWWAMKCILPAPFLAKVRVVESVEESSKLGSAKLANFANFCKFLTGSFSAVSKRKFARKYAFDSIFQALQDLHTFAPLQSQNFRKKSV